MPKPTSPEVTNPGLGARVYDSLRLAKSYVTSYYQSRGEHALYDQVKTYCMFVGHARSGGSITGALLDAHPNIVLADEMDVLNQVAAGFSRDQIYHMLIDIVVHRRDVWPAVVVVAAGEQQCERVSSRVTREDTNELARVIIQPVCVFKMQDDRLPQALRQDQRPERGQSSLEAQVWLNLLVERSCPAEIDQGAEKGARALEIGGE